MNATLIITILIIGLFGGFFSGLFGVGGGVVIIPALMFFVGMTQHQAQGTSLGILSLPVVFLGAFNYYKQGHINIKYVLIIAVAFFVGAYFGSKTAVHLSDSTLKKIFGALLLFTGFRLIFSK